MSRTQDTSQIGRAHDFWGVSSSQNPRQAAEERHVETVNVAVSSATRADIEAVTELISQTGSGFDVEQELARAYAKLWVARVGGANRACGFLLAWDVADEVHLLDLVVAPERRREGVGRELLKTLLDHARGRAARWVLLEVRQSNRGAQRLYEGAGFAVHGERRDYYGDGEAALEMRLELPAC